MSPYSSLAPHNHPRRYLQWMSRIKYHRQPDPRECFCCSIRQRQDFSYCSRNEPHMRFSTDSTFFQNVAVGNERRKSLVKVLWLLHVIWNGFDAAERKPPFRAGITNDVFRSSECWKKGIKTHRISLFSLRSSIICLHHTSAQKSTERSLNRQIRPAITLHPPPLQLQVSTATLADPLTE